MLVIMSAASVLAKTVSGSIAEIAATGAIGFGLVQAFREARAKLRARKLAQETAGDDRIDGELLDRVLKRLSETDRARVLKALRRHGAAKQRYVEDIIPSNRSDQSTPHQVA